MVRKQLPSSVHVLVVPYPAQGHVLPLMELSHKLVDHGVKVTFVNTKSTHNKIVTAGLSKGSTESCSRIRLVSIPVETWTADSSKEGSRCLEELIKKINEDDEDEKIRVVMADLACWWALEVAEKLGIKRAAFSPASVAVIAMSLHIPTLLESGIINKDGTTLKHDEMIQLAPTQHKININEFMWNCFDNPTWRKIMFEIYSATNKATKVANWILCNSSYELESETSDLISNVLTVGPLLAGSNRENQLVGQLLPEDSTCLTWLDQQPANSVIYIAFGSITTLSQEQFNELVHGIELMGRPYLWVVRPGFTDGSTIIYPDGMREKGKIVDWAPQQKVLAHPSIACFITHCGWNSTMESLASGVPFLCWPSVFDQFHNSTYICDIWKIGLKLRKDGNGIISGNEIKTKVQELIGDERIRTRVLEMKEMTKKIVSEGGSSWNNFQNFIEALKC